MDNLHKVPTLSMNDLLNEIGAFLRYLLGKTKLFVTCMLAGLLLAGAYAFLQGPKFEGKASFILEEKSSMGGGLSGLASQFGLDIGGLTGSAGLFAGDNILDILKSRTIVEKVLLTKTDSSLGASSPTLADNFLIWSKLKKKWSGKTGLSDISFAGYVPGKPLNRLQDSVLLVIHQRLIKKHLSVERLNKKGSIIEVTTQSPSETFSTLFTERLVLETMRMYVDLKTSVATRNIARMEHRSDSLMQLLNAKSYKSASLQVLDANAAYKAAAVPVEVTQRDKTVTYALYTEVMKNLEASRMALAGQTPVINLLDHAKSPLQDQQKAWWLLLLAGAAAGFGLALLTAFYTYR